APSQPPAQATRKPRRPRPGCAQPARAGWRFPVTRGPLWPGTREASQGNVSMPARIPAALLAQGHPEGADQSAPSPSRLDDIVYVATLGGDVRIRKALRVIGHQLLSKRGPVAGLVQLPVEHDVDRALGSHHG